LASLRSEAAARDYLRSAEAAHPDVFAGTEAAVTRAELGGDKVFYRVVAGGFDDGNAARAFCGRLRAADPEAFCKVLAR
jgi:hypothetical protein